MSESNARLYESLIELKRTMEKRQASPRHRHLKVNNVELRAMEHLPPGTAYVSDDVMVWLIDFMKNELGLEIED